MASVAIEWPMARTAVFEENVVISRRPFQGQDHYPLDPHIPKVDERLGAAWWKQADKWTAPSFVEEHDGILFRAMTREAVVLLISLHKPRR